MIPNPKLGKPARKMNDSNLLLYHNLATFSVVAGAGIEPAIFTL